MQSPATTYQGVEASGNVMLTRNLNLYGNAAYYTATYDPTGLSVANVPQDIETIGLFYRNSSWSLGGTVKRIGPQWQDNTKAAQINQAYQLDTIYLTNLSANYTFSDVPSYMKSLKLRVGMDNIFNNIYVAGVKFGSATSVLGASATDTVLYTAGRSMYVGLSGNF